MTGIIIDVAEIDNPPNLVTLLSSRLRNAEINRRGSCPEIILRGRNSFAIETAPIIYVDRQRTADTCILDAINPVDVARIEVYSMGVAPGAGYLSSAGGLILVFTKSGNDAPVRN